MSGSDQTKKLNDLIRLWAYLDNKDPVTVTFKLKKLLHIDSFDENESAQKLAILYIQHQLKGDK